jgi:hypothetical protein
MPQRAWKSTVARGLTATTGLPDPLAAMKQLARDALAEAEVQAAPVDLALVASFQDVRSIELAEMTQAGRLIPDEGGYRMHIPSVSDHLFHKVATTDSEKCRPLSAQSRDQGEPPVAG